MHELEVPISSVVARHLGTGLLLAENRSAEMCIHTFSYSNISFEKRVDGVELTVIS